MASKFVSTVFAFINHRNFLLSFALILGLILGDNTWILPDISVYILALVMVFATLDFDFNSFFKGRKSLKIVGYSFLLNYIAMGGLMLLICYFIFPNSELWIGCVLLAAAPPGPSVVPFSAIMKGNVNVSVLGLFGLHILAIAAAPLILILFTGNSDISIFLILGILFKTIVVPIIISRPLRHKSVYSKVVKLRPNVINWGFFLIILPIVGQSKEVMLLKPELIWQSILLFTLTMFVAGFLFFIFSLKNKKNISDTISYTFFLTTKSSAFAAVVVFASGNVLASIPSAVHAFFVTVFFLVFSAFVKNKKKYNV